MTEPLDMKITDTWNDDKCVRVEGLKETLKEFYEELYYNWRNNGTMSIEEFNSIYKRKFGSLAEDTHSQATPETEVKGETKNNSNNRMFFSSSNSGFNSSREQTDASETTPQKRFAPSGHIPIERIEEIIDGIGVATSEEAEVLVYLKQKLREELGQ